MTSSNPNDESPSQRQYDLEDRTFRFAKDVIAFVDRIPRTIANVEIAKQLVKASGSVGANYIEANESLGRKDFLMKIRISRKESKESRYWLKLVTYDEPDKPTQDRLTQESTELMKILGAILRNATRAN